MIRIGLTRSSRDIKPLIQSWALWSENSESAERNEPWRSFGLTYGKLDEKLASAANSRSSGKILSMESRISWAPPDAIKRAFCSSR